MLSKPLLILAFMRTVFSLSTQRPVDKIQSFIHYYTYMPTPTPQNVVAIGASYAGYLCAEHLSTSLPSGWRVVLAEKNSHFNHTWLFPRASVVTNSWQDLAELSYIPYPEKPGWAPRGSYLFKRGKITQPFPFDTSSSQLAYQVVIPSPSTKSSGDRGLTYFHTLRTQIKQANGVIIIGGGPVGIEVALDVTSEYPGKHVTLVHSRNRLVGKYGERLHDACMKALGKGKVNVLFGERVSSAGSTEGSITLSTGKVVQGDVVIMCTGAAPAGPPLTGLSEKIMSASGMIKVNSHLQVADPSTSHVFAVGDIADTGVRKMGRAAVLQGVVAARNIVRQISDRSLILYKPGIIEGTIDMSLGLHKHLLHVEVDGTSLQFLYQTKDNTMQAGQMWKMLGAESPCFREDGTRDRVVEGRQALAE